MAEAVTERVKRYILDGSDEDLRSAKDGCYEWAVIAVLPRLDTVQADGGVTAEVHKAGVSC
jgi:hypothetical protein